MVRRYSFDNLKFFLIFCVVLAHLLEVLPGVIGKDFVYKLIYTFHMPAFIFVYGYFSKFSAKRLVKCQLFPYVVFQVIYTLFADVILKKQVNLQFSTPYWILWYLLVCVFYHLLIPVLSTENKDAQLGIIASAFALSVLVGFDGTIGYYWSLSRFFVFLPWFVLGFYFKKNEQVGRGLKKPIRCAALLMSIVGVVIFSCYLWRSKLPWAAFYGSAGYAALGISAVIRVALLGAAFCWINLLMFVFDKVLNKKVPLITTVGQNTFSVFLLHGFVSRSLPLWYTSESTSWFVVLLLTISILVVFGNRFVGKSFSKIFTLDFLGAK